MNRARMVQLGLGLVLMTLIAAPVLAQPVAGVRVVETAFDGLNLDIDFYQYYAASANPYSTAWIGFSYPTYSNAYVPAVDWGDGNAEPPVGAQGGTGLPLIASSTTVGGVPVHIYRGSFSHTFAAAPVNPIRVNSRLVAGIPTATVGGNVVTTTLGTLPGPYYIMTAALTLASPPGPIIEVPTASEAGLLALALLLAGAAFVMIRRS